MIVDSRGRSAEHRPPGPAPRPLGLPPDDFDRDPVACLSRLRGEYGDVFAFARGRVAVARPEWVNWALTRTGRETRVELAAPDRRSGRRSLLHDDPDT
ncbi:hypothetical protein [Glycomyces sp. NPDC047010]|uniref:hypothetical protein n=1 Tax=Glycomyces sp. NPDC047010 TaxID=3155023 RepID=UPI0033DE1D58